MQANRILGLAVLFVVTAAATMWWVANADTKVEPPAPPATVAADGVGAAAEPAAGVVAAGTTPDHAVDATLRVEAASASAAVADAAVLGQVVDDSGRGIAGAVVKNSRGFEFDAGAFTEDFFDAMADDPQAAMATVRADRGDSGETTTDADGRFRLAAPSGAGRLSLRVEARGHRVLERNVSRPAKGDLDLGVLQLERGAIVSGRVVDRAGRGIADASVARETAGAGEWMNIDFDLGGDEMPGFRGDRVKTDADGRFELPHAAPGTFSLRARHPEHPSTRQQGLTVAAGVALADVLLVLEPGASIRGRVVGVPDGARALRVAVSSRREGGGAEAEGPFAMFAAGGEMFGEIAGFGERSAKVDADGRFVLRGLHIGRAYKVWATQSGRGVLGNATCSERLDVTTPIEGIELHYDAGITVTFQVVDDRGEPVERLWVQHTLTGGGGMEELMSQAMGRSGRPTAYPEGRVTIANLRPKDKQALALTIGAVGFHELERKDIALPRRGELDLGVIRLAASPVLHLKVVAQQDGAPLEGATVRVRPVESDQPREFSFQVFGERRGRASGTGSARTDGEGRCLVNAPTDAPFVVVVSSKQHARHESAPLTLAALAGAEHVVQMLRGGRVEVTAVDADQAIAAAQRIDHLAPDGSRANGTTGDAGVAVFERLAPGEHRFRIGDRAGGAEFLSIAVEVSQEVAGGAPPVEAGWQSVQVADGATVALRLVKPAGAQLRGVVRENGLPLADARLAFLKGAGGGLGNELAEMMAGFGAGGGGGRSARAGADGSYQLRDLPEGSHRLRITSGGRTMPATVDVELRAGDNVFDVDLDVASVRGIVRDAEGVALAGASVRITPVRAARNEGEAEAMGVVGEMIPGGLEMFGGAGGRSAKTDDGGQYELRGVQPGVPLQVRATKKGFAPAESAPFEVASGQDRGGVDLQLVTGGRIKVTMAEKMAFVFASARLLDASGQNAKDVQPVMQMLPNGSGTLDGLQPGRWRVTLRMPNGEAPAPVEVDVVAGATATVAF